MFAVLVGRHDRSKDEDSSVSAVAAAYQKENSFILPQNTREYKPRERVGV
jgi:hypothetical protein